MDQKQKLIDFMLKDLADADFDSLVRLHCYHKHHDDRDAQDICVLKSGAATRSLINDLPTLLDGLIAPAYISIAQTKRRLGGSRFGGTPDVADGFKWPLSSAYTIDDAFKDIAPSSFKKLLSRKKPLPMTFIAQISLSELAELADLSELPEMPPDLPRSGRLLVFMDFALWFKDDDKSGLKIIWDKSPVSDLKTAQSPEIFEVLDKLARVQNIEAEKDGKRLAAELLKDFDSAEFFKEFDIDDSNLNLGDDNSDENMSHETDEGEDSEPFNSGFLPPERSVKFEKVFMPISSQTLEFLETDYYKRIESQNCADIYRDRDLEYCEAFEEGQLTYHQLFGIPYPEQDDPRYYAFDQDWLGTSNAKREDYDRLEAESGLDKAAYRLFETERAKDYVMLLQLDQAQFMDMNIEGHFYIFIKSDDLKALNFDNPIVVYQQT